MKLDFVLLFRTVIATASVLLLLLLDRIWFEIVPPETFWKLLLSVLLIGVFTGFVISVKKDLNDEKKLREDKHLN